mgnify:CR=1 FL=1
MKIRPLADRVVIKKIEAEKAAKKTETAPTDPSTALFG